MKAAFDKRLLLFCITITLVACGGGDDSDDDYIYEPDYFVWPSAPHDITIENDADGNIVLRWNAVENADSYNLYWSTSDHSDLENRMDSANVTETTFIHKNLSLGTTYFYAIAAVYGGWESDLSRTSPSATAGAPARPVNLSAESVSSDIKLSWGPAELADTYNVSWSNRLGESGTIEFVTSPYLHTGLAGVEYEYVVTASNAYGSSLEVAVAAFPDLPPETPAGPGVRVWPGYRSICLPDLEDCSGPGSDPVTLVQVDWPDIGPGVEYDVYRVNPSGTGGRITTTSISFYSNSYRSTSRPPESYCYYVVARNNFGESLPTPTKCGVSYHAYLS